MIDYNDAPKQPNPHVDDVTGYRRLSQAEIDLLNEGKRLANQVGAFCERLERMSPSDNLVDDPESIDKRWLAIGRTQLQQGFMAVIRSIAKPTSF